MESLEVDGLRVSYERAGRGRSGIHGRPGSGKTGGVRPRHCPCGTGLPLAECCGRLHDGSVTAATAEQLMRSRYSAFALGDTAYLLATWHPTTRPRTLDLDLDRETRWTGLDVQATTGGSLLSAEGTVEFRAHYVRGGVAGAQHENSRFVRADGHWRYLDGVSLS